MTPSRKIVITGGGTGGHVFPALAIAEELKRRGFTVLYVGTAKGMEARLVPEKGIPFFCVRASGVKNKGLLEVAKALVQVALAVVWGWRFLRRERPDAVVGVGGYVSVPICVAAWLRRIPVYLQEQNVSVGIANRYLGRLATAVFLGFEEARRSFRASKCVTTGNPIRPDFLEPSLDAYHAEEKSLLILGGSQGARAVNEIVVDLLEVLLATYPGLKILHQTGAKDFDAVNDAYKRRFHGSYQVAPFIRDMAAAYRQASLVISRSGALTVSELLAVRRPAVFVPFPRRGQNDQTANAYLLEKHGIARVVEQGDRFKERFWAALLEVFRPDSLAKMHENASRLPRPNALATIGDRIEKDLARA